MSKLSFQLDTLKAGASVSDTLATFKKTHGGLWSPSHGSITHRWDLPSSNQPLF